MMTPSQRERSHHGFLTYHFPDITRQKSRKCKKSEISKICQHTPEVRKWAQLCRNKNKRTTIGDTTFQSSRAALKGKKHKVFNTSPWRCYVPQLLRDRSCSSSAISIALSRRKQHWKAFAPARSWVKCSRIGSLTDVAHTAPKNLCTISSEVLEEHRHDEILEETQDRNHYARSGLKFWRNEGMIELLRMSSTFSCRTEELQSVRAKEWYRERGTNA